MQPVRATSRRRLAGRGGVVARGNWRQMIALMSEPSQRIAAVGRTKIVGTQKTYWDH